MKPSIQVEKLSKSYSLGPSGRPSLRDAFQAAWNRNISGSNPDETLWALKDVSFTLNEGDALGIVGANGVGKSTLLKVLARLTEPTSGRAILRGKVTSLLELGTGFHPELTGKENIFLNGAFLGMRRKETERKLDAIVAFSELEDFLNLPVKRYSTGMSIRLAIGVALHLNSDILLMDEVMEVLDAEFKRKCFDRLREKKRQGSTMVLVSHDENSFREFCDELILLHGGRVIEKGNVEQVLNRYKRGNPSEN